MNQTLSTKRIAMAGVLAALTCATSGIRVIVPLDLSGTTAFHLGNILCALSGILLGPGLGFTAAGLGSFLFDLSNPAYVSEAWITFLTKGTLALFSGLVIGKGDWGYVRATLAAAAGALAYALIYLAKSFFYNGLLLGGLTQDAALLSLMANLPATFVNAAAAILFAPLLAVAIRRALKANHLTLD